VVAIYFDPWPQDTSWRLTDSWGTVIADFPQGYYVGQDHVFETLRLEAGKTYIFTIEDSSQNGIMGPSNMNMYDITLTDGDTQLVLVEGNGDFGSQRQHTFLVPTAAEYMVQSNAPETLSSPAPTEFAVLVYIFLDFDDWHEETSWKITDALDDTLVYASVEPGYYRYGDMTTEQVYLPPGRSYKITVMDVYGDGGPKYSVSLDGKVYGNAFNTILAVGDGLFTGERSHEFAIPSVGIPSPSPSLGPTLSPSMKISFFGVDFFMEACLKTFSSCQTSTECCNGSCTNNVCRLSDTLSRRTKVGRQGGGVRGDAGADSTLLVRENRATVS
jgi:hypothetical protein